MTQLSPILGTSSAHEKIMTIGATAVSLTLLIVHLAVLDLAVWHLLLLPLAWVSADLLSGIVHWTADTWGSEDTPVIGPRFIRPFRVHHINANDIVSRSFFHLNGDVALGVLPILAGAFLLSGAWRVFIVALAFCILPTNQIHQWAHQDGAPRFVRGLQRVGLILGPDQHRLHHTHPYRSHFCITTGWCNGFLERTKILARVEERIRRRAT